MANVFEKERRGGRACLHFRRNLEEDASHQTDICRVVSRAAITGTCVEFRKEAGERTCLADFGEGARAVIQYVLVFEKEKGRGERT
jgi:hypothetical protein